MIVKAENITLNNGVKMPIFGLGTYLVKGYEDNYNAVKWALEQGYRHIDTADIYQNHRDLAKVWKELNIDPSKLFITSKFWNINQTITVQDVVKAVDRFLAELEIASLDLVIIHWPDPNSITAYKGLEECYKQKKVRAIGVSNFSVSQLKSLIQHTDIIPAVNQVQLSPGLRRKALQDYCASQNIKVISWQTLGGRYNIMQDPTIMEIAHKYNVKASQICLRWAYQEGLLIIPKSVHEERIIENASLDSFVLTDTDMELINNMHENDQWWPFPKLEIEKPNW